MFKDKLMKFLIRSILKWVERIGSGESIRYLWDNLVLAIVLSDHTEHNQEFQVAAKLIYDEQYDGCNIAKIARELNCIDTVIDSARKRKKYTAGGALKHGAKK